MSTIKVTNIQNPSSGTNDIQIATNGDVTIGGLSLDAAAAADSVNLDASGRLLVGTSSSQGPDNFLQLVGDVNDEASITCWRSSDDSGSGGLNFIKTRGSVASPTVASNGDNLGIIRWHAYDGSTWDGRAAQIEAEVDGGVGSGDTPGRLVFSTTADGASSPTERMRIDNDGGVLIAKTDTSLSIEGVRIREYINITRNASTPLSINRLGNDGALIQFFQADTLEGAISVSGTTVTYGGGHLARWSQLPNDEDPSGILKGTVMSNLDEMCEWTNEDNEQLNKTKISDVEGDPNVAGVFVATSFDEEGPKDFFVAMTGDMVIRIAAGTTIQRGDLLMSAGDGTAKPQDDDIIRSKTIAKVTSTNVSCTYDDGSYCVPCVLMAC